VCWSRTLAVIELTTDPEKHVLGWVPLAVGSGEVLMRRGLRNGGTSLLSCAGGVRRLSHGGRVPGPVRWGASKEDKTKVEGIPSLWALGTGAFAWRMGHGWRT